jgi:hypothetical protein
MLSVGAHRRHPHDGEAKYVIQCIHRGVNGITGDRQRSSGPAHHELDDDNGNVGDKEPHQDASDCVIPIGN